MFPTYQCLQKGARDFLNFFRSWVICKNKKRPGFYTLVFYVRINNSRSKQNKKKILNNFFGPFFLNSMVVGARKNFQFFGQKTWFLGNNRPLP